MRVLHVYSGNLYGGVETMLAVLARERDRCPGMEPHFALCFDGRQAAELRALRAPVHLLGNVRVSRPGSVRAARSALGALLPRVQPDCVVCHSAWPYALFAGTARRAGLSVGFWLHDAVRGTHWTERWARFRRPDLVIYNSAYTGRSVSRLFPRTRSELVHCPVSPPPPHDRDAVRAELSVSAATVVIAQVGRMQRWKGHTMLVHALGLLGDVPEWECWIVGGAQRALERVYERELRNLAASRGVQTRVRFLGERHDVGRLLNGADIFCQPNLQAEPFGVAIVEALYAGLPVVATDLGGPSEILAGGRCGVLVPPGQPGPLADTLRELVTDRRRRSALGTAGPTRARELSDPAAQLARLRDVLTDVVHRRSSR